nr:ribonuclease H-like domain-containing protein [Tanacetum cinerariifolium]
MDININALYNNLKQNQGDVNDALGYKKKVVVIPSDPLALGVEKTKVSKQKEKVVVSLDSEGSGTDDFNELKKITTFSPQMEAYCSSRDGLAGKEVMSYWLNGIMVDSLVICHDINLSCVVVEGGGDEEKEHAWWWWWRHGGGQETTLPHAFTVRALHDPTTDAWNMDAKWIQDFMTRRVLLLCDSTEDLYPITAPSLIPYAFFVSQNTCHQRLGHLGSEVLRHLVSNNIIPCNKEKPLVLFHACQLGKHIWLPFASFDIVVTSCFDIIHSDVWTSPISSLSGF